MATMQPTFTSAGEMLATSPLELSSPTTPLVAGLPSSPQRSLRTLNTELRPLDMDELEPLTSSDEQQRGRLSFEAASTSASSYASRSAHSNDLKKGPRSSTNSDHSITSNAPLAAARYITVSAVLSRSGAAIPLSEITIRKGRRRKGSIRRSEGEDREGDLYSAASSSFVRRKIPTADEAKRREASNGSALEALGALLLQRDSSGKVANLSFKRLREDNSKSRQGLSRVSSAWLQGVREAGAARLGIRMPENNDSGQTIAQRRARRQGFLFQSLFSRMSVKRAIDDELNNQDFTLVGTSSGQPTFEVGKIKTNQRRARKDGERNVELPAGLSLDNQANESNTRNSSIFGVGSAFGYHDPPDAPPSPIAMPGAWSVGGPGWGSNADEWQQEGALLLPPPLLDDHGSDAKSFEGLLGVRRMREQQRARKELEKLRLRNRPAHKIGMLTAFGNFVKAAHAADQSLKAASTNTRPDGMPMLHKRHTEPVYMREAPIEVQEDNENSSDTLSDTDGIDQQHDMQRSRSQSQSRKSTDSSSRPLNTVYEGFQGISTQNGNAKRSSVSVSSRSSLYEHIAPRAPRLLPIYMTTTYPNTPFALDTEEGVFEMERSRDPSEPPTPRLGPTLLSLPPSPWIHSSNIDDLRNSFSLQLSMQPIYGPPGAPRLAPTSLEIAPSPYAMSPSTTPFAKSPRISASLLNGTVTPAEMLSPLSLSPLRSPALNAINHRSSIQIRARKTASSNHSVDVNTRMTPSTLINGKDKKVRGESANLIKAKLSREMSPKKERVFWLWFLFGDLGLKSTKSPATHSKTYELSREIIVHFYGFEIFILAHLVDLTYRIVEFLSMTFWFIRWMLLNLTGQTVLARCIVEAYRLVKKEWQTVSLEDHEERGDEDSGKAAPRGLTRWQVVKGLIELVCLQDVTRDRYMVEGAGLEELKGWQQRKRRRPMQEAMNKEWVDLGAKRQADRDAVNDEGDDQRSSSDQEDSESDDDMVVTRQGPEILEFTKTPKTEPRSYFGSCSSADDDLKLDKESAQSNTEPAITKSENRALVKTIQWASRLAISAYGLHVTLVDLPSTFTPSGNRFSRQTFAHLSRLHHEDVLHADIQTLDSESYFPTFYLVKDVARRVIVVSVRGTQSLQDIIVDLELVVDQVDLSDGEDDGAEKLYCHAGVLRAAKALLSRQSTLFKTLNEALQENEGFGIVFTGHSLGGAIASTVVLLLSRYVCDPSNNEDGIWVTHENSGLPSDRSIRAITFAHPATVNAALARRAGKGKVPLVLSVVLGSDLIPRCGHGQARELRRVLGGLSRVRKRKGDLFHHRKKGNERDVDDDARVHIVTSWWRWKQIKRKGSDASKDDLKKVKRIEDDLWSLRCDVENDLYAAVKLRSGKSQGEGEQQHDSNSNSNVEQQQAATFSNTRIMIPPSPWIGPAQRAKAPLHQLASRRQALDFKTLQNEESIPQCGILVPAGQSILIYSNKLYQITSPLSFFSLPDFHPLMFADHFPSAYETALIELH